MSTVNEKKVNKTVYAILTILLGTIGINKFYAKNIKAGILSILFCWTGIPTILSIAEFITVLTEKADKDGNISSSSDRRCNVRFYVCLALFTLFVLASIIPWESLFETTIFTDFNTMLSKIKIGDYSVFGSIVGTPAIVDATTGSSSGVIPAIGSFTITDLGVFLFLLTGVIALCSKIKMNEFISASTNGIKKVLPVAITAMLISIVLVLSVTTGINITIANVFLSLTKGFNIATSTVVTMIDSVLTSDFYYFVSTVGTVFTAHVTNTDYYGIIAFIMQSVYYVMMLIAPTSVGLIIGLYYLNIPYNKWFKFIWKVFAILLAVVILTSIVLYILI